MEVLDMHDLWPEDIGPIPESKGPVIILREQASLLGKKTNNLVEAEVVQLAPSRPEPPIVALQIELSMFVPIFNYAFLLVAPPLNNYRYNLFTISHGIDAYPVTINVDMKIQAEIGYTEQGEKLVAKSEDEFVDILKKLFSTQKTKKVIGTLLSMINSEPETALLF